MRNLVHQRVLVGRARAPSVREARPRRHTGRLEGFDRGQGTRNEVCSPPPPPSMTMRVLREGKKTGDSDAAVERRLTASKIRQPERVCGGLHLVGQYLGTYPARGTRPVCRTLSLDDTPAYTDTPGGVSRRMQGFGLSDIPSRKGARTARVRSSRCSALCVSCLMPFGSTLTRQIRVQLLGDSFFLFFCILPFFIQNEGSGRASMPRSLCIGDALEGLVFIHEGCAEGW